MKLIMIVAALHSAKGALLHGSPPASTNSVVLSGQHLPRRAACTAAAAAAMLLGPAHAHAADQAVRLSGLNGPGKSKTNYPDYTATDSGLQVKDFKPGSGHAQRGQKRRLGGATVGHPVAWEC